MAFLQSSGPMVVDRKGSDFKSSKEKHLFKIEMFCNIMNVFTVTFDPFSIFFLNRKHFFNNKKKYLTPHI